VYTDTGATPDDATERTLGVGAVHARVARAKDADADAVNERQRRASFGRSFASPHRAYAAAASAEDDFSVLGVKPGCTEDELKKAYRREALKWHPDRHVGDAEKARAEARFKRISAAYQTLSAPGGREGASYGYSSASSSGASSRAAQAESARRAYEAYQRQPGYGASSGTEFRYRQDFTRADADRIFREMFGGDSSSFVRELERALREGHARGGFGPMGSVGGFAFRSRGFAPGDLEDMFNAVFGGQTQSGRRGDGSGYSEVRESSYVNARGETVIRRVIRTRGPSGAVSESVTERVVSPGARGGAYYGGSASSSSSYGAGSGGGSARAPPPPGGGGSGGGAVQSVNPLVELAVGAARVARVALARFIATFGARLLQQAIRFLLRRLFGGR
jgi:curved DNA-binding protein CbpA